METFKKTTRAIVGLFSGKPPKPDIPLQEYLNDVYARVDAADKLNKHLGEKMNVAIAVYLEGKGTGTKDVYAGRFALRFHFSGSLIKVAAMFAAFKLRKAARDLITELKATPGVAVPTPKAFFDLLDAKLKLATTPVAAIRNATGTIVRKPDYEKVLKVTGTGASAPASLAVDLFQGTSATDASGFVFQMRRMIVDSNNCSAGECIARLSYPYINVALMEEGFFDSATMKGIWLCGDYIEDNCFNVAKKQDYIRLDTENDCNPVTHFCGSAQNTTAKKMAQLYLKILRRELVDPISSDDMMTLLRDSQAGPEPSFISRHEDVTPLLFDVDGVKIGIGPLKPDPDRAKTILSEGIIITWRNITDPVVKKNLDNRKLTGRGAICWQNLDNGRGTGGVATILNEAIDKFIRQVPI